MNKPRIPKIRGDDAADLVNAINLIADGSADRIEKKLDKLKIIIYYMNPGVRVDVQAIRGTEGE